MELNNFLLIVLGITAIIIELALGVATGLDFLIIGVICIISGIAGEIFHSFNIALSVAIILSLLYVFFGRRLVKNTLSIDTKKTNIDSIIGKKGTVVKSIQKHKPGQVKIEGEIWRAEADEPIEIQKEIMIQSVSGITLKVKPV